MERMNRRWYAKVAEDILKSGADVLFIVDASGIFDFPDLIKTVSKRYPDIVHYNGEIGLRKCLKKLTDPLIVVFEIEKDIPYHMLSDYAVISVDTDAIFPLLDKEALSKVSPDNFQPIYDFYVEHVEGTEYERLSIERTVDIIDKSVSSDDRRKTSRMRELEVQINELLDSPITGINEWVGVSGGIATRWGELMFLADTSDGDYQLDDLKNQIEDKFKNEILNYYDDTVYGPNLPMHWNLLDRIYKDTEGKKAILCFDCMGFEEWNAIKEYLDRYPDFDIDVRYSLAILPTETNFSRTTIFSGSPPKKVIESGIVNKIETRHEEKLFKNALKAYNVDKNDIYYQRCTIPSDIRIDIDSLHNYEWIGLVFTFIDDLTHNSLMTKRKLVRDIQECLEKSSMAALLEKLFEQGFQVYLVSDHGSVFAKGNGVRISKDLVDQKARRYLIFDHKALAEEYESENTVLIQLKHVIGDRWLLLLTGDEMFGNQNETCLTHGGGSIEEVVVPYVGVKGNERV